MTQIGQLDTTLAEAYSFSGHDEGLRMLSLLSVVLLLHRDREAVCRAE
jgi:hypothetical protein